MKLIYFLLYNSHFKGFYIPYKFSSKVVQGISTNHRGSLQFSYPLLLRVCHGIRGAEEIFILFTSLKIFSSWNDLWVILSCKLVKLHLCFLVQKHFGYKKRDDAEAFRAKVTNRLWTLEASATSELHLTVCSLTSSTFDVATCSHRSGKGLIFA